MAPNIWPRLPLPRKKSDDHHLPTTEKQRFRPQSSAPRHSNSTSTASRVTISQSCFREEPTVVHTALSLREVLEREGFSERKITFIVVEGRQQWVEEEISGRIGGAPGRLFAAGDWGPVALPQVCDGGMYFELETPSLHYSLDPTRLRTYIHIRHRNPSTSTSTPADRLQHTYPHYPRTANPPTTSTTSTPPANTASTTGPWITIIILTPHPPLQQNSTPPQHDTSLPSLLKRYYRTNNAPLTIRLLRNPCWLLLDLLTVTHNLHGEAWLAEIPGGTEARLDWSFLFPRIHGDSGRTPLLPAFSKNKSRKNNNNLYHPHSPAEKAAVLYRYVDGLLGVVGRVEGLRNVLERLGAVMHLFDLSALSQVVGVGMSGGLGVRDPRGRNSFGSASIEEESSSSSSTIGGGSPGLNRATPNPQPPRNPSNPSNGNSTSSSGFPQQQQQHTPSPPATPISPTTSATTPSTSSLQSQITTSTTHLTHILTHLTRLHLQAQNLQNMLSASNAVQQQASISTLAALGVVLGPVGLVAMVFLMIGFGDTAGRGAAGWVYPIIGAAVVGVVGGIVGVVRRCGV